MECNCDCHKATNASKLKKCEDKNRQKEKKIQKIEKKVLTLTLIVVIIGTLVGKEALDSIMDWLNSVNEVKSVIKDTISVNDPFIMEYPQVYGTSPGPATLAAFGCLMFMPTRRRK